jgi:hypothetical protein
VEAPCASVGPPRLPVGPVEPVPAQATRKLPVPRPGGYPPPEAPEVAARDGPSSPI